MLTVPFLTDLDSRAAVKGSRDPLGIQPIWTRLGRHVVGNLTTVSNSIRDFTTLLLGYYFAERLADELGPGTELSTFLKWEQLAAYARTVGNNDTGFRGTERVQKQLAEGHGSRVPLSQDRAYQILGNQKIYGLWGLYTMPARASGLIDDDPPRLTPAALDCIETVYLPILEQATGKDVKRLRDILRPGLRWIDIKQAEAPLIQAIAHILKHGLRAEEREFYRFHLLHGGPRDSTKRCQQQLASLLTKTLVHADFAWSPGTVGDLAHDAEAQGAAWHRLAYRLARIRTSETVLAPVSSLFTYLLGLDGISLDTVTRRLHDAWGGGLRTVDVAAFRDLRGELGAGDTQAGDRWVVIAEAIAHGEFGLVIDLLIDQNTSVMAARGGAPWVEKRDGTLRIRFRDEQGTLPTHHQIGTLWRFSYFLDSLRTVSQACREN